MLQPPGSSSARPKSNNNTRRKTEAVSPNDMIQKLSRQGANRKCVDCTTKLPNSVNLTLGCFLCMTCSGIHRELNYKVKGIHASHFTTEEANFLSNIGNEKVNEYYLANFTEHMAQRTPPPSDNHNEKLLRNWIHRKYKDKAWVGNAASNAAAPPPSHRGVAGALREPTVAQIPPRAAPPVDLFGGFSAPAQPPVQQQQQKQWNAFGDQPQQPWNAFAGGGDEEFPADFGSSQTKQRIVANFDQDPFAQPMQGPFGPSTPGPPQQQQQSLGQGQPQQQFNQPTQGQQQQQQFGQPTQGQQQQFGQPSQGQPQQQQQFGQGQPQQQFNQPTQGQHQQQQFGQLTQGQPQQQFGQPLQGQQSQQQFGQPTHGQPQQQQQQFGQPSQGPPPPQQQFGQPTQGQPQQQQQPFGQPSQGPPQQQQQHVGQPTQGPPPPQQQFGQPTQGPPQQQQQFGPSSNGQGQPQQFGQQQQQFGQPSQVDPPNVQGQPLGQSNMPPPAQTHPSQFGQSNMPPQQTQQLNMPPQQQFGHPSLAKVPPPETQSVQQFGDFGNPNQANPQPTSQNALGHPPLDKFDAFNSISAALNDEPIAAPVVEAKSEKIKDPSKYKEGQKVCYKSASYIGEAEIVKVHLDDDLQPFYTIRVQGKEKQTDDGHLSSTMQEHVQSLIAGMSNEQLLQVQAFIATLVVETTPPIEATASVAGGSVPGSVATSDGNAAAGKVMSASAPPTPQSAVTGASVGSTQQQQQQPPTQQSTAHQTSMPPLPQLNTPAAKSLEFSGIPSPEGGPNPSVGVVPHAVPQLSSQPPNMQNSQMPPQSTMQHPTNPNNNAGLPSTTMPTHGMPGVHYQQQQGAAPPTSQQLPIPAQQQQEPIPSQQQWQQPAMTPNFPGQQNPQNTSQYAPQQQMFGGNQLGAQLQNNFSGPPSGPRGPSLPNNGQQMLPQMNGQMMMQGQSPQTYGSSPQGANNGGPVQESPASPKGNPFDFY